MLMELFMRSYGARIVIWIKDEENTTSLDDQEPLLDKNIIRIINILGQEIQAFTNQVFFEIYEDGTVNKKVMIK